MLHTYRFRQKDDEVFYQQEKNYVALQKSVERFTEA
jgi:hypothetical protein